MLVAALEIPHVLPGLERVDLLFGHLGRHLPRKGDRGQGLAVQVLALLELLRREDAYDRKPHPPQRDRLPLRPPGVDPQVGGHADRQQHGEPVGFREPAPALQDGVQAGDAAFGGGKTHHPLGLDNPAVGAQGDEGRAGPVRPFQPRPRDDGARAGKGAGDDTQGLGGQVRPARVFQEKPVIGHVRVVEDAGMVPQGFDRGEAHDRERQNDEGGAGERRAQAPPAQVAHPEHEGRHEGFPAPDLAALGAARPGLEAGDFLLEAEEDDQRHDQGQPHDEEGEDHHHGAVGQLEGRVHVVDQGDEQHQNAAEGGDAFVDVGVGEQQPLQAEGERHEQRNIEQHAIEDVLLGLVHIVVHARGQCPGTGAGLGKPVVLPGLEGRLGRLQVGNPLLLEAADALVEDAARLEIGDARPEQGPHVAGHPVLGAVQEGEVLHLVPGSGSDFSPKR